jgi:hypothetical protein
MVRRAAAVTVTDHRLERAIAILLMSIGVLLIGERFLPACRPSIYDKSRAAGRRAAPAADLR